MCLVCFSNNKISHAITSSGRVRFTSGLVSARFCFVSREELELEEIIGDDNGQLEQVHAERNDAHALHVRGIVFCEHDRLELFRVGLDGRENEGGKERGEQSCIVDVRVSDGQDETQTQSEAEVVGPARFDMSNSSK